MDPRPPAPRVPCRKPFLIENLAPGEYRWCACGRSRRQPWCDGAHAGSGLEPLTLRVGPGTGTLWLCACKHTRRPPHCDGSHNRLPAASCDQ